MNKKIILITIDCLRRDRLNIYGKKESISPNIDKICKNAIIFNNTLSNGPNTPPSFYSLFTSKIPGIEEFYTPMPPHRLTLPMIIQKNNIRTCGIHSNPYLGEHFNYNLGFDDFFDLYLFKERVSWKQKIVSSFYKIFNYPHMTDLILFLRNKLLRLFWHSNSNNISEVTNKNKSRYSNAEEITKKTIRWLQKRHKSSFFLWVHYMDAHPPYFPPNEFVERVSNIKINDSKKMQIMDRLYDLNQDHTIFKEEDKEIIKLAQTLYNAEINYLDHYIGILFAYLKEIKIFNQTNIIITADHGEAFFEHKSFGHIRNLYDELLRIPLIMKLEELNQQNKLINIQVGLMDLSPTILELFNISMEEQFEGNSLMRLIKGNGSAEYPEFVISSVFQYYDNNKFCNNFTNNKRRFYLLVSCRTLHWKLLYNSKLDLYEFYDLYNDPKELKNLINYNYQKIEDIIKSFKDKLNPLIKIYKSEERIINKTINKDLIRAL